MNDISKNITFVTHLRYDHQDRIVNLQTVLNYYASNFENSKFILVEDDKMHSVQFDNISWPKKRAAFYFMENPSWYHRTRALNYGFNQSNTDVVISLDTDCVVSRDSILSCVDALMADATIAWPYNGYFIDVNDKIHSDFISSGYNFETINRCLNGVYNHKLGTRSDKFYIRGTNIEHQNVGGIVMFNRKRILDIGGYNENFVAWGAEDNEIMCRGEIMGHKLFRDERYNAMCFHLFHQNALRSEHPYYQSNFNEWERVKNMSRQTLAEYISAWRSRE